MQTMTSLTVSNVNLLQIVRLQSRALKGFLSTFRLTNELVRGARRLHRPSKLSAGAAVAGIALVV